MEPILRCRGIKKRFGGVIALDGVDLDLSRKEITMLIGPNGSGKTTLINVTSGQYLSDGGEVFFEDTNVTDLGMHERFRLGLVRTFQIPKAFLRLTVLENMVTAAAKNPGEILRYASARSRWAASEVAATETALHLTDLLKLGHLRDEASSKLSGGQMKLLEAGRALMCGAKLILMDEPAAGINPVLAHEVFSHLRRLTETLDVTLLVVEHRLEIALKYVDSVHAMANGRIIASGSPNEVLENPVVIDSYLGR
ncbi:MAG: ABC transporter ATP-binding protein [Thaumarchaeota archaeon]|nr:ABC transporter ATP-binding protein [Nitrososphaerota archaeon]